MRRLITGRVQSRAGDKTITVNVVMRKTHPIYKKQYTRHRKFMAHDEQNEANVGDLVVIAESRPLSARKRFVLEKIIERAQVGYQETDAQADVPLEELEKKEAPRANIKAQRTAPPHKEKT
jgi:small subunit ribosomal protein S17